MAAEVVLVSSGNLLLTSALLLSSTGFDFSGDA